MKYKKPSKNQILISIDRLTRFKPTEEKYRRVFLDIILSNLSEPQLKKSEIADLPNHKIRDIAVEIFNSFFSETSEDFSINQKIQEYENSVFINNPSAAELINNKLNYKSAISLIPQNTEVLNLKWLKALSESDNIAQKRIKEKFLYPIEKVIIAEGITEEILLPEFSKICGYDFDEKGVKIIAAGGKNQVVKLYYKLIEELKLPIFILLDKDAERNEYSINSRLRTQDKVYLLNSGEFEDLLPKSLIKKTINNEFRNFLTVKESDLDTGISMVKTLEELFKEKCLHEFKKADFAQRVKTQISTEKDLSEELKQIIGEIKNFG